MRGRKQDVHRKSPGFGLLEIIVAITIFSMGTLSAMATLSFALRSASTSQFNLVAANLVQEGVEIVRNKRDTNWVRARPWDDGLADGTYQVAWNLNDPQTATPPVPLLYDAGANGFNYVSGTPSIYTRVVTLTRVAADEIRVVATVTWQDKEATKSVSAEEHLFNWR